MSVKTASATRRVLSFLEQHLAFASGDPEIEHSDRSAAEGSQPNGKT